MSDNACQACGVPVSGHGNRTHCDPCLTVVCAGCGEDIVLKHPSSKREQNYHGHACMKNGVLRAYVAAHMGDSTGVAMAGACGVSRQRIGQLVKEIREARRGR